MAIAIFEERAQVSATSTSDIRLKSGMFFVVRQNVFKPSSNDWSIAFGHVWRWPYPLLLFEVCPVLLLSIVPHTKISPAVPRRFAFFFLKLHLHPTGCSYVLWDADAEWKDKGSLRRAHDLLFYTLNAVRSHRFQVTGQYAG